MQIELMLSALAALWLLIVLFAVILALSCEKRAKRHCVVTDEALQTVHTVANEAGFLFEKSQDIFVSALDPWQRQYGYCGFFNSISSLLGMVLDAEPFFFDYADKHWLIELWKGQYGMTYGAEIGVYTCAGHLPSDTECYECACDEDLLPMHYTLFKQGEPVFSREDTHWWLTGFKLGGFAKPRQLSLEVRITLKTPKMRAAFVAELEKKGYEYVLEEKSTVSFAFHKPASGRGPSLFRKLVTQNIDRVWCFLFASMTKPCVCASSDEKLASIITVKPRYAKRLRHLGGMTRRGRAKRVTEQAAE